jgi:type I restriction enzyme S subunit
MADQPLIDISPDNWQIVRDILQRYLPNREVWAFGSRAKWTAKEFSDLDIAVIGDEPLSIGMLAELNESFQDSALPFKVDVVDWAAITPSFRQVIEAHKVLLSRGAFCAVSPAATSSPADEIEWKPFTELLSTIIDNRGRTCPVGDLGIPLIATNCIDSESLYPRYNTTRYVSAETYQTWFRGHPKSGDILFVCKGSPGRTNWTPDPVDFCIAQDMVAVRADPRKIYPKYLFAALRSSVVLSQIDNMHVGTMIPHFKKGDFDKLNIPVPDKKSQHEIGDFYFVVSERIDLIRKTNSTLEAIAQALFKSWFVDFDPVRANAEGRETDCTPPEIAGLFPSEFEDSELGEIPKGWKTKPVYDLAEYINGAAYKAFSPNSDKRGLPIIKIAELKAGITSQTAFSDASMPEKYLLETGDILLSWSGNPETSIDTFIWHHGRAWLNQHIFRILIQKASERPFVLQTLKYLRPVFAETARNKQTTGLGHFTVADMKRLLVVQPSEPVLLAFGKMVAPIHARIFENEQQAITLTSLRDSLLPKLMTGNVAVVGAMLE